MHDVVCVCNHVFACGGKQLKVKQLYIYVHTVHVRTQVRKWVCTYIYIYTCTYVSTCMYMYIEGGK